MITLNLRMLFLIPLFLSLVGIGYFSYTNVDYNNHNRMVTCGIDSCKIISITQDPPRYIASVSYSISIFDSRYSNSEVLHAPDSGFCDLKTIGCVYNEYQVGDNPELRNIIYLRGQIMYLYVLPLAISVTALIVTIALWAYIILGNTTH